MGRSVNHPGIGENRDGTVPGRLVEVRGIDTFTYDFGEGETILFLHGYGDTADCWRKIAPVVGRNHRVVVIDIPPFGRSDDPRRVRSIPSLLKFYYDFFPELFDRLNIGRATLVGHSMGGGMAVEIAGFMPDRVSAEVLVSPAGLGPGPPLAWHLIVGNYLPWTQLLKVPTPVPRPVLRAIVSTVTSRYVVHDGKRHNKEFAHLHSLYSDLGQIDSLLSAGKALLSVYTGDLIERTNKLTCPVSSVWGKEDRFVPAEHAEELARRLPHAGIHFLDGCGHYPQIEAPSEVTDVISATVRKLSPATAATQVR